MIIEGQFFLFIIETMCCDPSSERFVETVQMRGHKQHMFFMQKC